MAPVQNFDNFFPYYPPPLPHNLPPPPKVTPPTPNFPSPPKAAPPHHPIFPSPPPPTPNFPSPPKATPPYHPISPSPPPPHRPLNPPAPAAKPPRHSIPPPAPIVHPPPHPVFPPHPSPIVPTPPPPGHHSTVIVVVFVSLGGLFFLAFLSVALCCFIKKRKKKMVQETDTINVDEHVKVQEAIIPGPHGAETVILTVEEDEHIHEEIKKNEKVGEGSHFKLAQDHHQALDTGAATTDTLNVDEHVKVQEAIIPGPHGAETVILTVEEDAHIHEEIKKNEKVGEGSHFKLAQDHHQALDTGAATLGSNHHFLEHKSG